MTKINSQKTAVLILAAGQGKRMKSSLPKVLHEVAGEPMLFHVLHAVREASCDAPVAIVVGHGREKVEAVVRSFPGFDQMNISFVHQPEQRGTGHAARLAIDSEWGIEQVKAKANILVLPGDLPLLPDELVRQMIAPLGRGDAMRLLTCELPDPTGYGRIVRRGKTGAVLRIVEQRDASEREKAIREVGASIYLFQSAFMKFGLSRLSNKNAQGEYYLTDLIAQAVGGKKHIDVLRWEQHEDLRGVNDPWELSIAARMMNERIVKAWCLNNGVRFIDPASTWVDRAVTLSDEVVIYPGAVLRGKTSVGPRTTIGAHVVLRDTSVGQDASIKTGTVAENSKIGDGVQMGPYAHLRPDSVVATGAKIGNFVELKKTVVGENTSVAHLSYLGDAQVGKNVNIGCGFVTCNFDGRVINGERKHRTVIEDDVFLGSDCQALAPVRIGKGSYIASGSTITEDVEPEALAIARSRQVNKPGYARKLRQK